MALVTSTFLSAVAACSWVDNAGGCLRDASGNLLRPCAAPSSTHSNPWSLAAVGSANTYAIPSTVYQALRSGTANTDGSYTTDVGATYWLGLNANGTAVADLPSGPPPP